MHPTHVKDDISVTVSKYSERIFIPRQYRNLFQKNPKTVPESDLLLTQQEVGRFLDLLGKINFFRPLAASATERESGRNKIVFDTDVALIFVQF